MAPEIIKGENEGYGFEVDWFALGIVLYEIMIGQTPFYDENPTKVWHKILNDTITFPEGFDDEAMNLIKKLTRRNPSERYGATPETLKKLKNHSFYKFTCWKEMMSLASEVPSQFDNI
jgi:serine/threonine protein kinase